MLLCLPACATHYAPIKSVPAPLDLPDAALVQPCDVRNGDPTTNMQLALEAAHNRHQRNDCAAKVDGLRQWRADAVKRADEAAKAVPAK